MELMQLQGLIAVAEQGTLHKAAVKLSRTTPAVSAAIRKLEKELGVTLFEHSNSQLRLTAAGEELVNYAKRLLSLQDEALAAVEQVKMAKACRPKSQGQAK